MKGLLIAFFASLLGAACIAPGLLLFGHDSLVYAHDPEAPMHNIFALVSQWTHGGIALFDRFDQFNYVYTQLTSGVYTLVNTVLALVYLACAPFLSLPAEGFHHIYSFGFHALTILLRTAGGYLLLKRLKISPWITMISLVVLNTALSLPMYFGLLTNNLYSYLPLLLYFIWAFFDEFDIKHFLGAFLVLTVAVANSPLYALGYFYMVVHFFIVSCLLVSILNGSWRRLGSLWGQARQQKGMVLFVMAVAFLIMLPWAWMFKFLNSDFFIAGSGMQGTHGRLNNIFDPMQYFVPAGQYVLPLANFFLAAIDFAHNDWEGVWVYMGAGVLVLSLIGIIFSRHCAKWALGGAIALVLLSNAPLDPRSPLSLAHWINVLTNPFHFLLRSFHMPALLMPVLFFPLAALGLQAITQLPQRNVRRVCLIAAVLMLIFDGAGAVIYARHYQDRQKKIMPYIRFPLAGFRPLILDYQNPLHLPLREYVRAMPVPTDPPINSSQNLYGLFYKYSPLERYFMEPSLYNPLPRAYQDFYGHKDAQGHNFTEYYLNQDTRWMFLTDAALKEEQLPWPVFLGLHLERRIALADGISPATPFVLARLQDYVPWGNPAPASRTKSFSLDLIQSQKNQGPDFTQYRISLPGEFPAYMATGVFTRDIENIEIAIDGRPLSPVQGKITQAWEFDINNMRQGFVFLSLPLGYAVTKKSAAMTIKQSGEILSVWLNEHDNIGVNFLAVHNGWLVIHLPYDSRWRLTMDGQKANIYRVNKYFIGAPITKGEHKILLEYWPGSLLRPLIAVSVVLTLFGLLGAIGFAYIKERTRDG